MTLLAHLTSETLAHGSTTSLRALPEPADCEYREEGPPLEEGQQGRW